MELKQLTDKMWVSPQIQPEDIATLKQFGIEWVINNRPDGEEPGQPTHADIKAAAEAAGLNYRHVPVVRGPSHAEVEEMREALADAGDAKVFAFCRSGTRSTLTWAVAQAEGGADEDYLHRCAAGAGYDLTPVAHLL